MSTSKSSKLSIDYENKQGRISTRTRSEILGHQMNMIDREINHEKENERRRNNILLNGNGKYTHAGSDDRINGADYRYPEGALTEEDQKSYYYGYTTHGGRRLLAVVEELIKEGKYEEVALIAERDYNHGLEKGHLGLVENNSVYIEAFNKIASKGNLR